MKPRQLTLRDLFWLMLVAGLMLAWWLEQRTHRQAQQEADRSRELLTSLRVETETLRMKLRRLEEMRAATNDP